MIRPSDMTERDWEALRSARIALAHAARTVEWMKGGLLPMPAPAGHTEGLYCPWCGGRTVLVPDTSSHRCETCRLCVPYRGPAISARRNWRYDWPEGIVIRHDTYGWQIEDWGNPGTPVTEDHWYSGMLKEKSP